MEDDSVKVSTVLLVLFIVLFIISVGITMLLGKDLIKSLRGNASKVKVVDSIESMDYKLTDNNTAYFKKLYYELKDVLKDKDSEGYEEKYASLVAQLFLADFYDLDSKTGKADVGGVQFVYKDYRDSFKNAATDANGIYYYVENNVYGDRKQSLPSVEEVIINSISTTTFVHEDIMDADAYLIKAGIHYEKSLGYDTSVTLVLIHNGDKLEVAEMN